ncbi:hypothetical protein F7734_50680 [Scytonema sp. UIC 10036]|uniref:hypothetical protein n=1 Tax=Scytonema sp. UIC 10036 TaxID=2304196 RepID=UPI0012DA16E1|nr:hypothetical protein [Scytonema sp. UIC 10036]MUH00107.1 hypothetical protein [Scytonema sp. UIC 10036]
MPLTSFHTQRVRLNRWVDELRAEAAEAVPFLGISPSGAIAAGGTWGRGDEIAPFSAYRAHLIGSIKLEKKDKGII